MGFIQGRNRSAGGRYSHWWVPTAVAVIACLIALGDESFRVWLRYDRLAIESGEFWRLLSGHFAHLSASHLGLNLAGLFLVWAIVGRRLSTVSWWVALLLIVIGMDLGFWVLDRNLVWYVGLSGLLHGILIAGTLAGLQRERGESLIILGLVFSKVVYEQIVGPLPGSEMTSGGPVVVNAHLYGAASGLFVGLLMWLGVRLRRSL